MQGQTVFLHNTSEPRFTRFIIYAWSYHITPLFTTFLLSHMSQISQINGLYYIFLLNTYYWSPIQNFFLLTQSKHLSPPFSKPEVVCFFFVVVVFVFCFSVVVVFFCCCFLLFYFFVCVLGFYFVVCLFVVCLFLFFFVFLFCFFAFLPYEKAVRLSSVILQYHLSCIQRAHGVYTTP